VGKQLPQTIATMAYDPVGLISAVQGHLMSSPLPAMSDMKANGVPDDIVAARMKDLADRLAASKAMLQAADIDAPLGPSDVEIEPVSLTAVTALRGLASPDTDDAPWLPATPQPLIALSAPSEPADAPTATDVATVIVPAPPPPAEPAMSRKSSETASERNLASLLAVLEQPKPLRLTGELPTGVLVPAESPAVSPLAAADPAEHAPESTVTSTGTDAQSEPADADGDSLRLLTAEPASATGEPLLLADQSAGDIRLVDLVKRQQSLLDQLNSYPPAPSAPEQPVELPADPPAASAPAPAARSVVDDLAPTLPMIASNKRPYASDESPPPFPHAGVMRLTGNTPDDDDHLLPERAPMIIERARAERSGLHRASNAAAATSPLPAFAAGVAIALAIAGSLLFVL
jgi:hypothetical protein